MAISLNDGKFVIAYKTDGSSSNAQLSTTDGTIDEYDTWQEAADAGIVLYNEGEYEILEVNSKDITITPKA